MARFPLATAAAPVAALLLAALLLAAAPVAAAPVAAFAGPATGPALPPVAGVSAPSETVGQTEPAAPAEVVLLTMGPDESVLFRQWGHAALCIAGRCLNYGVTDFSRSLGLVFDVLRGGAVFWVSVSPYEAVLDAYIRDDRSVFRQEVALSPAGREVLLGRLASDLVPGQGEYIYDHFDDNCTTRIRDYLDEAADGALREPVALPEPFQGRGGRSTFRTHIRRGLTGRPLLLWLSDVGVGAAVDRPITSFEAMFLPAALRQGVEAAYGAPPLRLHRGRDGDLLPSDPGSGPYLPWLFGIAGGLALLIAAPRTGRLQRLAVVASAAVLTLVGAVGLGMPALSPLPEFRSGLVWAAIPAGDFLLATRHARWYGPARLAAGAVFLVLVVAGVIRQPLGWTALAALLPVAAIVWRSRRPAPA